MKHPLSLTAILITLAAFSLTAQEFTFELLETDFNFEEFGRINTSEVDAAGNIWIGGSNANIAIYNGSEWEVLNLKEITESSISSFTRISDIFFDSADNVWVISNNGLFLRSGESWSLISEELEKDFGYKITESDSLLYVSTRGGVMTYDGTTWGYEEITGNQPGFVAIDADGIPWVTFANGDGNHKKASGEWIEVPSSETGPCTTFGLDVSTSPDGYMWLIGASGRMCFFDGSEWIDVKNDGGVIGILNETTFSPEGDHTLIGGEDFISGKQIKHFFNEELVATYGEENGLKSGEVTSLALYSESEAIVFYEDAMYRGAITSSTSERIVQKQFLKTNIVRNSLILNQQLSKGILHIYTNDGQIMKSMKTQRGSSQIDISLLPAGQYYCLFQQEASTHTETFIKL